MAHFSVEFEATDSDQVVKLADGMEIDGLLQELGSIVLVNVTADKGHVTCALFTSYCRQKCSFRATLTGVWEPKMQDIGNQKRNDPESQAHNAM